MANTLPAGDMAHDTVDDAPPVSVVVHAELEEMAQKTPALRDAKGERVADAGIASPRTLGDQRVRGALAVCLVRSCSASDTGLKRASQAALASR